MNIGLKLNAQEFVFFRLQSSGSSVGNVSEFIQRGEVGAHVEIALNQREIKACCGKQTAADIVFYRIIAEKGEMRRSAAGRYAAADRVQKPAGAGGGKAIQIRRDGCLQFGFAARFLRQAAP